MQLNAYKYKGGVMKILIIGATSETGQLIVEKCIESSIDVKALIRNPKRLGDFPKIEVLEGNVLDYEQVTLALNGCDAVICVLGASQGEKIGNTRSKGTENLINAMKSTNVSRMITVSTIGIGDSVNNMSLFSKIIYPLIIGKARLLEAQKQENLIINSGLQWTIVRPPRLINNTKQQEVRVGEELATNFSDALSRVNLAKFLVELLEQNSFVQKTITVVDK